MRFNVKLLMPVFVLLVWLSWGSSVLAHGWKAPDEAAVKKNPIVSNPASKAKGKTVYMDYCAHCHGEDATGLTSEDTGFEHDTPDLLQRLENHSEGDFFWKIQTGKGMMPSFEGTLSESEIWNLITHIKSL